MKKSTAYGLAAAASLALAFAALVLLRPGSEPIATTPEPLSAPPGPAPLAPLAPAASSLPMGSGLPAPALAVASAPPPNSPAAPAAASAVAPTPSRPPGGPGSPPIPAAAEPPADAPLTPEQFQALTSKTLRELPTPAQMRDLTAEDAHGYPEPLAKAGPLLGRIAQAVQDQPALKEQATEFYLACVQDREILTPVRALCYSHILKDPKAPPADTLPSEVVRLAHLIPADKS